MYGLAQLQNNPNLKPGSPDAAHLYFNSLWLGGSAVGDKLESISNHIVSFYTDPTPQTAQTDFRQQVLGRLENDLLQYRLLHKGFSRFYHQTPQYTKTSQIPLTMDGDCPFYNDVYRRIATMLYVKYVWL